MVGVCSNRDDVLLRGVVGLCGAGLLAVIVAVILGMSAPGAGLPDGRVYEAVSPVATEGAAQAFVPEGGSDYFSSNVEHGIWSDRPFEVAPGGEAVVYEADSPPAGGTGNARAVKGDTFLARRRGGGGWEQLDLQPPDRFDPEYVAFSSSLSAGVLLDDEATLTAGAPPEGYRDVYVHVTGGGGAGAYQPGLAGTPPNRTIGEFNNLLGGVRFAGLNAGGGGAPAATHVLFEANDALLGGGGALEAQLGEAVRADIAEGLVGEDKFVLYDAGAGGLSVVSVLPDGRADANASFGSVAATSSAPPGLGGVVSADGSRVFWTAGETVEEAGKIVTRPVALYVRENDSRAQSPLGVEGECLVAGDACTVQLDASVLAGSVKEKAEKGGAGRYLAASADGSRVFFSDEKQLTAGSTAAPGEPDLYECRLSQATGAPCQLSDLTVGEGGVHADVQGVLGAGEDGEDVYFVAEGVLAGNENANEEKAEEGQDNLYVYRPKPGSAGAHELVFIARLSGEDDGENNGLVPFDGLGEGDESGDWRAAVGYRTAQVAPDGGGVVFMSKRRLTGYDNEQVAFNPFEGRVVASTLDEVFFYEAGESGAGVLRCVSCSPSGAPAVATNFNDYEPSSGTPIGGYIPVDQVKGARAQPRVVSENGGRVFFDSGEPLTSESDDEWIGVYEWERDGTGSCGQAQGCVYLISGGDPEDSYLLGASATGADVFFVTRAPLVSQDQNENDDVYDAHECTGVSPCPVASTPAACPRSGCGQTPSPAPVFAPPASVAFAGPENIPPPAPAPASVPAPTVRCKKGFVEKKGRCVRRPRARGHAKKARRGAGKAKHAGAVGGGR
jgi:hypothetical protein